MESPPPPTSKALTPEQQKNQELEARINRLEREKSILKKAIGVLPAANGQTLLDSWQQSSLPILVDVHQWAYLPEAFHANIQACYIVIQQAEQLAVAVC